MTKPPLSIGKLAGLTAGIVALLYLSLLLLTPACGTITGYANQPPPLRVVRFENATNKYEVVAVQQLMKELLAQKPVLGEDIWPTPSLIEEHRDCWLVVFDHKVPIYRFLGHQQAVAPTAPFLFVTVQKKDLSITLGNWCR